jgi:hypothetical protein
VGSSQGERSMGRVLAAWLLILHAACVALALIIAIQLETDPNLDRNQRLILAGLCFASMAGAVFSIAFRLWKRWGAIGLLALHVLVLPFASVRLWVLYAIWRLLPWWEVLLLSAVTVLSVTYYALIFMAIARRWRHLD